MKLIIKIMLLVLWASQAYGQSCPTYFDFNTQTETGTVYYEASDWIAATNTTIESSADVTYDAGNYIELNTGFVTEPGAKFLAFIDGCDTIAEPTIDCPIDVLFIVDVSASIKANEFQSITNNIYQAIGDIEAVYTDALYAVTQYAGNYGDEMFIEHDFSDATVITGGINRVDPNIMGDARDYLSAALGLTQDALMATANPKLLPASTFLNKRNTSELYIVIFTDARADGGVSSMLPYTNAIALKEPPFNANLTMVHYDPTLNVDEVAAAIGSVGGNYNGLIDMTYTGSDGTTIPRQYVSFDINSSPPISILNEIPECDTFPPVNPCDSILTTYSSAPDSLGYCCFDIYIENSISDYFTNIVFKPFNGSFGSWQVDDPSAWDVLSLGSNVLNLKGLPGPFIPTGNYQPITFCLDNYTAPPQQVQVEWVANDGTRCSDVLTFDCAPPPEPCPTVDVLVNHDKGCCYEMTLNNTNVATPIYEIQIDITGQPGISFDANSVTSPPPFLFNTAVSPKQIIIDNNGSSFPANTVPLVNFCLNNSGTTPVTSQYFEIKYFDINGNEIECRQEIKEGCELLPCTPDWYKDPLCTSCTARVEVIIYEGEKYIIFWADPYCSDALTIAYNYCDGTEFCREGGFGGSIKCSDLMPDLIKNHTVIEVLWSKDTDCDTNDCCADPCEFFDRVNAPILTNAPHADGCKLGITTVALNDCDQVTIDWGDGIIEGPFPTGNVNVSHVYANPGNYEVIMYVKEIGADGKPCWEGVSRIQVKADCEEERTEESQEVVFQNYPNPFNDQTTIEFTLTKDAPVTLLVYDSLGRQIASLLDNKPTATGTHKAIFDGTDYPSGVYYYTIQAGEFFGTQKMTLIK